MGIVASSVLGFTEATKNFSFGSAPEVDDYDLIGINSDTTVNTPDGFDLLDSNVNNQGSYVFIRQAVGGESDSVTITKNTDLVPATLVWGRISGGTLDAHAKATAVGSSSGSSPEATTSTLAETGELAVAFAALHRYAGSTPTDPAFTNGFEVIDMATQGSGNSACAAILGSIENVGTDPVSTNATWTNGTFDRDTYIVTFTIDAAVTQTVSPSGISTGEALGTPAFQFNQTVTPTGISSGEAFGVPFINNGVRTCFDVQGELNRIAGTWGLGEAGAANIIAGTTGLDVVGALNTYVGNTMPNWLDLQGVANQMANTSGLGVAQALSLVDPV
jgi:hypothetical protein